jgi:glycosyltransferase involved in cell wall biosynthesis
MIHVVHMLEATEGGTRRWIEDVLFGLQHPQIAHSLICAVRREPDFAETVLQLRAAGISVWVLDMRRAIHPWRDGLAMWRIVQILRTGRFEIIHAHSAKAGVLVRIAALLVPKAIVVYTPHAYSFLQGGYAGSLYHMLEKYLVHRMGALLAVSRAEAATAVALGCHPDRVQVIVNGVAGGDPAALRTRAAADRAFTIGTVARFCNQKDHESLIRAVAQLRDAGCRVTLEWCGAGPSFKRARQLVLQLGLAEWVSMPGRVDDVAQRMAGWDAFVLSTRYEGMSYALLDAMAAGLPVVATRVQGVKEVISHRVNGFLVEPGSAGAICDALSEYMADQELARRVGEAGREHVLAHYSLDRQLWELTAFYLSKGREMERHDTQTAMA